MTVTDGRREFEHTTFTKGVTAGDSGSRQARPRTKALAVPPRRQHDGTGLASGASCINHFLYSYKNNLMFSLTNCTDRNKFQLDMNVKLWRGSCSRDALKKVPALSPQNDGRQGQPGRGPAPRREEPGCLPSLSAVGLGGAPGGALGAGRLRPSVLSPVPRGRVRSYRPLPPPLEAPRLGGPEFMLLPLPQVLALRTPREGVPLPGGAPKGSSLW